MASVDRNPEALANLAYLRKTSTDDDEVIREMAEIQAAIEEERVARSGLGLKEAFLGKGNLIRFVIAFVMFLLQQWSGQNSVGFVRSRSFTRPALAHRWWIADIMRLRSSHRCASSSPSPRTGV